MTRGRREEVIPSAARLLTSLRDLGYDFVNAVADLIDNSIAAGAGRVDITIHFAGEASWVRIADDGAGMSGPEISEALRLGSGVREYGDDDLGKFGLGLKTASLSQARTITVASRTDRARRQIECRRLDLADVEARDRWEILHPAASDRPWEVVEPLQNGPGTVVLWTDLDRVLGRRDPFGAWTERHLLGLADRLDLHLGMVMGRFITGEARRRKGLSITINGTKVELWDPFCLDERTEHLPERELPVAGGIVRWRPYVLPPQRDFSGDDAWRRASGPKQWNRQQGLYIYRADRMIQSGGWSWLRAQDEHTKLARAALEFWPDLDDAFEINVSKMRVKLPDDLREQLKPLVSHLTRRADERYRQSSRRDTPPRRSRPGGPTSHTGGVPGEPATNSTGSTAGTAGAQGGQPHGEAGTNDPPHTDGRNGTEPGRWARALERAATQTKLDWALARIRAELQTSDPEVARDLGW